MKKLISLAVAIASVSSAYAQETTLETVIVSATRSEQLENVTPSMISVTTAEQIEQSGAQSVADVLRATGAVQLRDIFGDGRRVTVSMRGFGPNAQTNALIMIDGRRLNNPTLEAPNLNTISVQDIERIEILHGSAGVLYGEQAVAGVINIITKTAHKSGGNLKLSSGSYGQQRLQGSYNHRFQSGFGLRISGDTHESDGYRDNNRSAFDSFTAEASYEHENGDLFVEHQQINDNLELPGALTDAQLAANRRQSLKAGEFFNQDLVVQRVGGNQQLSESLYLSAEYSERNANGNGAYLNFLSMPTAYSQDTRVRTFSPRLIGEWDMTNGELVLTAGYDWIRSDYVADFGFGTTRSEQEIEGLYAQAIIPVTRDWTLTAGARRSEVKDLDQSSSTQHKEDALVTEFGLAYQIDEQQRIFLRRDESFRYANLDENGLTVAGVDFLAPQEGESWELGWEWHTDKHSLKALLYRLDLENEIYYDPVITNEWGFQGANVNLDTSRREGFIVENRNLLSPGLEMGAVYTFTDAELTSGSFAGKTVPYVAEHSLNLFADYQLAPNWNLFVDAQYTGSRYQDNDYDNAQTKIGDHSILNASLRWADGPWHALLKVNNLTNREVDGYTIYSGGSNHYPAPERNLLFSIGYRF